MWCEASSSIEQQTATIASTLNLLDETGKKKKEERGEGKSRIVGLVESDSETRSEINKTLALLQGGISENTKGNSTILYTFYTLLIE